MKRICSLLLVIGIFFTFLPLSAFAEEWGEITERETVGVDQKELVGGYSLAINDSTDIKFRVKQIASNTDQKDYTLKYSFAGETKEVPLDGCIKGENSTYITVAECTSRQYTQNVSVDVCYQNNSIQHYDLSIEKYCISTINDSSSNKDLKDLCRKLLDYGYYAQEWFEDSNPKPSDTYRAKAATGVTIPEFGHVLEDTIDAIDTRGISLDLKSYVSLNYYIKLKDSNASVDNFFQVSLDGTTYTPISINGSRELTISRNQGTIRVPCTVTMAETDNPGEYRIEISKIPFVCLDQKCYLKAGQDDQTTTVAYSPMEYCYLCQNKEYGTLLKALYNYYTAAKTYFGVTE